MAGETPWSVGELRYLEPEMVTQKATIALMQMLTDHPEGIF